MDDWERIFCDMCESDSHQLLHHLIYDIQLLSSEVVRLRFLLSRHLPLQDENTLRQEILSNLHSSYDDYAAYQRFVTVYCHDCDPLERDSFVSHLSKLSHGEDSHQWRSLTF